MELRDFEPERVAVRHKGEVLLTVRGLNLSDISELVKLHLADLRHLSNLWQDAREEIFATVMQDGFLVRLVSEVPSVAASMLALGSDHPGEDDLVAKLPLGFQIAAIKEILRMTLEDVGGPKGVAALIGGLVRTKETENPMGAATTTGTMF